jgi:hypothetical protein
MKAKAMVTGNDPDIEALDLDEAEKGGLQLPQLH